MLKGNRPPNKVLMYQKHMPYSKGPTLELAGVPMSTWWSYDGKKHMLNIVHFLMIVNKVNEKSAMGTWCYIKQQLGEDSELFHTKKEPGGNTRDIMNIVNILQLLHEEYIPYPPQFPDACRFRDTIIATLAKFENDAVSAAACIAQEATHTVINDTESDSDMHDCEDDDTGMHDAE